MHAGGFRIRAPWWIKCAPNYHATSEDKNWFSDAKLVTKQSLFFIMVSEGSDKSLRTISIIWHTHQV